jgi:hypothetical protein
MRALPLLALALLLPLAACGGGYGEVYYDDVDSTTGYVYVWNNTAVEWVETFFIAPAGEPFGPNELGAPIPPGVEDYIGEFWADWYDAEADTDLGGFITWFDVWVGDYDDTVFEVV